MEAYVPAEPAPGTLKAELRRGLRNLAWPLRPRPLAVLLATSVLALGTVIPVLALILALALATVVFHTGFRALEHTAREGLPDSERLVLLPDGDTVVRSVVFLMALMAWGALSLVLWTFGGLPGALAGSLLLAGILPAVIVSIGREHALVRGLLEALSPKGLIETLRIADRPYAVAAGLPLVLAAIIAGTLYGMGGRLAPEVRVGGSFLLAAYTTLLTFRLAACLAARYSEELGYARKRPRPAAPSRPPKEEPEPTADERVSTLIKADRLEEAAEVLRREVKKQPTSLHWWERYYRLLHHLDRDQPILAACKGFLTVLLTAGEEARAMEVIHDALNRDPGFRPAKPDQVFRLARIARRENRPKLALRIMNGFAKRHPQHPNAPMVLLFSARIVGEDFHRHGEACQLLDSLLRHYPDHPLAGEAPRLRPGFTPAS